jgi:hypothetical protein
VILPLANARDRRTQIRWGLADFEHRFGREAEAIWLAETAAKHEVLDDLIDHGLRWVILAPQQAGRIRRPGQEIWEDVRGGQIDPSRPYRYLNRDGSGRSVALFFYAGPLASSVSFGEGLRTAKGLADRVEAATDPSRSHRQLIHVAVDGETAGHHVAWGNRALSWALHHELRARGYRLTNYGQFLEEHPPEWEVELDLGPEGEGTSWSCAHGVGRWIRDCGCRIRPDREWSQRWRTPLRQALDMLRDHAARYFEAEGARVFSDPWAARDAYVELLLESDPRTRQRFLQSHALGPLEDIEVGRALSLLEMQHQLLLMYTSCGWFFDDVGGLETEQILKYAARALEIWEQLGGASPRDEFRSLLAQAESNDPERKNGAEIFDADVMPTRVSAERVAAHLAMCSVLRPPPEREVEGLHRFERRMFHLRERDERSVVTARLALEHRRTLCALDVDVAMLHTGGLGFRAWVAPHLPDRLPPIESKLDLAFDADDLDALEELLQRAFDGQLFGVEDLLDHGRRPVLQWAFRSVIDSFSDAWAELYDRHEGSLRALHELGMEIPEQLRIAAQFALRTRFERAFREHMDETDPSSHRRALEVVREAEQHGLRLECPVACDHLERLLEGRVGDLAKAFSDGDHAFAEETARMLVELLDLAERMQLELDRRWAQVSFQEHFLDSSGERYGPQHAAKIRELTLRLGFASSVLETRRAEISA